MISLCRYSLKRLVWHSHYDKNYAIFLYSDCFGIVATLKTIPFFPFLSFRYSSASQIDGILQPNHRSGENAVVVAENVSEGSDQNRRNDQCVPAFRDGHSCGRRRSADVGVG